MRFQLTAVSLACAALLSACGGGGGSDTATGAKSQSVNFLFPGAHYLLVPPTPLVATASSGLPVTFSTNTPATCTVDGVNLVVVKAGDTLPLLCERIYRDPAYHLEVARVNGLTLVRQLDPGMSLRFPPLV